MPGLAGIISPSASLAAAEALDAMLRRITHTRSSVSGRHESQPLGLVSGWVSGRDDAGDIPICGSRGETYLIVFGEDFSSEQKSDGPGFASKQAHRWLERYEEIGTDFLSQLNGSFCGLLVDGARGQIHLFNDRYGLNRIYFHESKAGFYFCSEAKGLLKVLPELRRFDVRGLGEFFSCGCVLQNRTLFEDIFLLPPGSVWTFRPGHPPKKQAYFQCSIWENQTPLSALAYYEELKATWRRVLPRYFAGHERVALSLTGGVDSRMILGWAPRLPGELPCYTFGGRYRDCADVTISRQLARACQNQHEVISVGDEFLKQFPALAEKAVYLSDGTCDVTGAIDLYVQERAVQIAPVRVTGTNGGEILRRLAAFKPSGLLGEALGAQLAPAVEATAGTYAREIEGHPLSFTAFKQAPWYMASKFILERTRLSLRMPYFDNDLVKLAYRSPVEPVDENALALRLAVEGNPALGRIRTDRDQGTGSLPGIRQVRHLFQEFTIRAEYAYDYAMPQWLAAVDHALAPLHLDRMFLGRHKVHHFRTYYRDELAPYVKEVLLDSRTRQRPYLDGADLERIVNRHVEGSRNYTRELHKLLSTELLMRQLVEQN